MITLFIYFHYCLLTFSTVTLQRYESKLVELEEVISKKTRELKRMKDSFDTIKTANDSLKKQVT